MRKHYFKNTGKPFEQQVANIATIYEHGGVLALEKMDPPTFIDGQGQIGYKRNPFVDFIGTWTERGGRSIFLEAKSTDVERLAFGTGGITQRQIDALFRWAANGAAVGVLWDCRGNVRFISRARLEKAIKLGMKSFSIEETTPVRQGIGFVLYDYAQNLREAYPLPKAKLPAFTDESAA